MVLVHPYLAQLSNIKQVDEPLREEKFLVTGLNFPKYDTTTYTI